MKKYLFLIYIYSIISSCDNSQFHETTAADIEKSRQGDVDAYSKRQDSLRNIKLKNDLLNPIKIYNYRIVEREYSNYRDISFTFKNAGKKRISAIKFKWEGINAFNQPADMGGGFLKGYGGGFTDEPINAGKARTVTYEILSPDVKKITSVLAYNVVFADGSSWEASENN